ncbi:MAG TPA: M14 family zinc carboxypeptidase, partial [Acetobacteraceae bacterium]|nr:M14 family zinc carboxypeptidase [Acetobacteraceae bacterium]
TTMTYLNVTEVETATVNLAAAYPALTQLITLPNTTTEGRISHGLRLGAGAPGSKDAVMMIFGVHAREWGSCEIALNLATDLLDAFSNNTSLAYGGKTFTAAQIQTLLNTLHIVLFPLVNPDGRHYSQTTDAMWRKNRNPAYSGGNPNCIGVDINRNYDFLFDFATAFSASSGVSVSADPCDYQLYHGPSAFSEAETQNVKWLLDAFPRTRWFIDIHSYSQDVLYNWGDDQDQTTNPAMNFQNPAFNGQRGVSGDAYKEFIQADDLAVTQSLSGRFVSDLQAVRGIAYTSKSSYDLYPTSGASDDYVYARHLVDPSKAKVFGYVVEWGTEFQPPWAEMEDIIKDVSAGLIGFCIAAPCGNGTAAVSLGTPVINFNNVPAGITTTRAAVFSVQSCAAVDLNVTAGPSVLTGPGAFGLPLGGGSLPAATSSLERDVRIWVSYTGTTAGDHATGTMTVTCPQTSQSFVIPITANTIDQPAVASCLVLDQSGSMDWASGIPNKRRIDVLHDAAPNFVALLPDNDGVGVVSFDQAAYLRLGITPAGPLSGGLGRVQASSAIANHVTNPAGSTSIGNGVELGHNTIASVTGYDSTALVVFTDGEENTYKFISDVQSLINNRVFAVGLGTVTEVNPIALNQLVNNTGGYLLLTDNLGPSDIFKLQKYFVQIMASATNADIVVDPDGYAPPVVEVKIPFDLTEADYTSDAMLLSPAPWAFGFQLETPAGVRIDHTALGGVLGVKFNQGPNIGFYRLVLPVVAGGVSAQAGRWWIVLQVSAGAWKEYLSSQRGRPDAKVGVPYSAVVHARGSLNMDAYLTQTSHVPGATLGLRAVLTEMDLPVEHRGKVTVEIKRPDGTSAWVTLNETDPGVFEGSIMASLGGIYPVHFRATGRTLRGFRFKREQLRTGMVWAGGDEPPPRGKPGDGECCPDWGGFLQCLLSDDAIRKLLARNQVNPDLVAKCAEILRKNPSA